jgi:hypothetical protein
MKRRNAILLVLCVLPWASAMAEQAATTSFRVAVKVEESCAMTATRGMLMHAACTPDTTYQVRVNEGASAGVIMVRIYY